MNREEAIEKVKKCLNLANCRTAEEAATAAHFAQKLIAKFNIEACLLEEAIKENEPAEDVKVTQQVLHTFAGPRVVSWPLTLASGLGEVNGCKVWWSRAQTPAQVLGAGRESDLATVSYMLSYLINEIERLCAESMRTVSRGGKSWAMSFKMGAVIRMRERLTEAQKEAKEELRDPSIAYRKAIAMNDMEKILELDRAPKYELAVIDKAIAKLDERLKKADEWVEDVKKRDGNWTTRSKAKLKRADAFYKGKEAADSIQLKPGKRLTGGSD